MDMSRVSELQINIRTYIKITPLFNTIAVYIIILFMAWWKFNRRFSQFMQRFNYLFENKIYTACDGNKPKLFLCYWEAIDIKPS